MRVLVVEDDPPLAQFIKKGLESEEYVVDSACDGEAAREMAEQCEYDLLVLDLNLPGVDGTAVLKTLREKNSRMPVLVLTARNTLEDRVSVLDMGADDYLVKPFSFSELSARLRALLRRQAKPSDPMLRCDDLELNRIDRVVLRAGRKIELTSKEFLLLEYLMRNSGHRVTRAMIIEHVWNLSFDTMTNVVDVYINYLRKKVDEGAENKLIHTVRGVGYQFGREQKVA
ncbi:MAG: two component transcriptional regulator, winged helix family [Acidobacteriaceae bacterium]|nr:two component transcriptional regulator, winged helix family [Acidobacteriaceae bacterium]